MESSARTSHLLRCSLLVIGLLVSSACGDDEDNQTASTEEQQRDEVSTVVNEIATVDQIVNLISSHDRDRLRGEPIEIEAWIHPAPRTTGLPTTPPQGCPVVPEKQDWITDEPIDTQIEVAGATLPNDRIRDDVSMLKLVVPYTLGFIDVPERAVLRGHVLDDNYRDCPLSETLFILDEIVEQLPAERSADTAESVQNWERFTHERSGVVLEYPEGWEIDERDTGHSARIRFIGPDEFRTIRLQVQEQETYWHPDANDGSAAPDVLAGDRREAAMAGPAYARLVDDSRRAGSAEREVRLVFNHQGNTVSLAMVIRDGIELESGSLWVFNEMAQRLRLHGDVAMSDPMDPVLAASDEILEGAFISDADAMHVAVGVSGMTEAEAVEADLVSERDARLAIDGACRDFEGRPSGVWLVSIEGVLPTGSEAFRLVYLDAETGNRLCQAEAPGVS